MNPLALETGTYTHLPRVRGGLSGRVATPWLFAVLCLISSMTVSAFWLTAGNEASIGHTSNVLASAPEHEMASSTALTESVDHLLNRSGPDRSDDETPSPVSKQPGEVSGAEDDTHKAFGFTVSFDFLAAPIEKSGSELGSVLAEPNITAGRPVTLLRGPPPGN